ncbi:MAG TPA: hypothetical protein PKC67_12735 [Kiritimatiellia bacterium]|nr:hypothetical protein [Kiritimatiellia bacterium]HMP35203.1 hypothetical protein [Kiritimatiellia bacterium]
MVSLPPLTELVRIKFTKSANGIFRPEQSDSGKLIVLGFFDLVEFFVRPFISPLVGSPSGRNKRSVPLFDDSPYDVLSTLLDSKGKKTAKKDATPSPLEIRVLSCLGTSEDSHRLKHQLERAKERKNVCAIVQLTLGESHRGARTYEATAQLLKHLRSSNIHDSISDSCIFTCLDAPHLVLVMWADKVRTIFDAMVRLRCLRSGSAKDKKPVFGNTVTTLCVKDYEPLAKSLTTKEVVTMRLKVSPKLNNEFLGLSKRFSSNSSSGSSLRYGPHLTFGFYDQVLIPPNSRVADAYKLMLARQNKTAWDASTTIYTHPDADINTNPVDLNLSFSCRPYELESPGDFDLRELLLGNAKKYSGASGRRQLRDYLSCLNYELLRECQQFTSLLNAMSDDTDYVPGRYQVKEVARQFFRHLGDKIRQHLDSCQHIEYGRDTDRPTEFLLQQSDYLKFVSIMHRALEARMSASVQVHGRKIVTSSRSSFLKVIAAIQTFSDLFQLYMSRYGCIGSYQFHNVILVEPIDHSQWKTVVPPEDLKSRITFSETHINRNSLGHLGVAAISGLHEMSQNALMRILRQPSYTSRLFSKYVLNRLVEELSTSDGTIYSKRGRMLGQEEAACLRIKWGQACAKYFAGDPVGRYLEFFSHLAKYHGQPHFDLYLHVQNALVAGLPSTTKKKLKQTNAAKSYLGSSMGRVKNRINSLTTLKLAEMCVAIDTEEFLWQQELVGDGYGWLREILLTKRIEIETQEGISPSDSQFRLSRDVYSKIAGTELNISEIAKSCFTKTLLKFFPKGSIPLDALWSVEGFSSFYPKQRDSSDGISPGKLADIIANYDYSNTYLAQTSPSKMTNQPDLPTAIAEFLDTPSYNDLAVAFHELLPHLRLLLYEALRDTFRSNRSNHPEDLMSFLDAQAAIAASLNMMTEQRLCFREEIELLSAAGILLLFSDSDEKALREQIAICARFSLSFHLVSKNRESADQLLRNCRRWLLISVVRVTKARRGSCSALMNLWLNDAKHIENCLGDTVNLVLDIFQRTTESLVNMARSQAQDGDVYLFSRRVLHIYDHLFVHSRSELRSNLMSTDALHHIALLADYYDTYTDSARMNEDSLGEVDTDILRDFLCAVCSCTFASEKEQKQNTSKTADLILRLWSTQFLLPGLRENLNDINTAREFNDLISLKQNYA